ncbi:MAG: MFS transporter [Leptospiraceae bacterium]|nr:MFS transporter [Leptospiraceae bacterium]
MLNKKSILFLGTAEYGYFIIEIFIRLYLLKYYTDIVELKPFLASIAISIGILWDAISDPIMGYISDHFPIKINWKKKTYIKKRIFYIIIGSFFAGIFISLIFNPYIKNQNDIFKFIYLLFCYIALNTFLTISSVPHSALCGEATIDTLTRNKIFGFRLFWGNLGLISGILIPVFLKLENTQEFLLRSFLLFFLIFGSSFTSISVGFNYDKFTHYTNNINNFTKHLYKILKNFLTLFQNRYLFILIISYIIAYIAIGINSTIALYYYEYFLKLNQEQISIILLIFLIIWTSAIPLWIYLAKIIGKKRSVILAIFLLGIGTMFSYPYFPEKQLLFPIIASIIGGILVASIVLLDTLIADLADYDYVKLKLKIKREGLFFGFLKFCIKISRALSIIISGFLLSIIGFSNPDLINDIIAKRISYIFGYGVGIIFIFAGFIFILFDYNEEKHNKVIHIIKKYNHKNLNHNER